jgi:hypothetical protein
MREIKNAHDLAKVWSDGSLINEKAIEDNLELITEIFKGTIYEIKEEE